MADSLAYHNVLVIAYYFPPLGLSGVQRTLKFVKYLPQYGWHPTVLTVEARGYFATDEDLLAEINSLPVEIHRTRSLDPLHFLRRSDTVKMPSKNIYRAMSKISQCFFIPDNKIGWKRTALAEARKVVSEKKFDVIFATAPPYTDFLIGAALSKEFGIPLVIDYRDAWYDNPNHFYATPFHSAYHFHLERKVLRRADRIITINRRMKELLIRRFETLSHGEIDIIPQGFDQEDFDKSIPPPREDKMRITYSGTFYLNRSPKYFLHALHNFLEKHPAARKKIEAVFVGTFHNENLSLLKTLHLEDVVRIHGYLPHDECIPILQQSDILWLMIGTRPGDDMMSTGKLFEYLGARKPILGCVPDGVAKKTIMECGAGFVTAPHDVQAITETIGKLFELHQHDRLPLVKEEYVRKFERYSLTGDLAKVFRSVLHIEPTEFDVRYDPATGN